MPFPSSAVEAVIEVMEKLVSSWFNASPLPETYVLPPEERPGKLNFPFGKSIPVLDLSGQDRNETIQHIMKGCEEFGFFQVINHGVPKDLMDDTMNVEKEFHAMSAEGKASECSKDPNGSCALYTSSGHYETEEVHYWRDCLMHPCHSLDEYMQFWPAKPTRYREIVSTYSNEVMKLASRILELISEGLKLEVGYFNGSLGVDGSPRLLSNHYPPCPDPCLTLGIPRHRDPSVITILQQGDVHGLQVFKDGEWIGVEPLAHAFVVNIGYVLQIVSNGKLKGAEHRVVTNSNYARTTVSVFIYPSSDSVIEPAKSLVDACNPPVYRALKFIDFQTNYLSKSADAEAVQKFISSKTD